VNSNSNHSIGLLRIKNGHVTSGPWKAAQPDVRYPCPCCAYPTLPRRGWEDICCLCSWQDDGQDDPHADEAWRGPNSHYSLTQARENFKQYLVIFTPDNDRRIGGGDSGVTLAAKKAMMDAFDAMANADDLEKAWLWEEVSDAEIVIRQEMRREHDEYAQRMKSQSRPD
jgi:hypothetical protein